MNFHIFSWFGHVGLVVCLVKSRTWDALVKQTTLPFIHLPAAECYGL